MDLTAICIVGIIAWMVVTIVRTFKDGRASKQNTQREEAALESEVLALKERVSVLEKIVTDENYELKKQFADL